MLCVVCTCSVPSSKEYVQCLSHHQPLQGSKVSSFGLYTPYRCRTHFSFGLGAGGIPTQNPPVIDLGNTCNALAFRTGIAGGSPSSFQLCDGPVERMCACDGIVLAGWLVNGAFAWTDRSEYKQSNG